MKFHYLVAAVTWIATVTAASESNSHGNWSNEKDLLKEAREPPANFSQSNVEIRAAQEQTSSIVGPQERIFDSPGNDKFVGKGKEEITAVKFVNRKQEEHHIPLNEAQLSKQLVQPYVLPLKSRAIDGSVGLNESLNSIPKSTETKQTVNNETVIVQVEYIPSREIPVQETGSTEKHIPVWESNSNDAGQFSPEGSSNIEEIGDFGQRVRSSSSRQRNGTSSSSEDYRKVYRKNVRSHSLKRLNASDNNSSVTSKDRLPFTLSKSTDSQKAPSKKQTDEEYTENIPTIKDVSSSVPAPIISVSLGKFSGPIVVPDLPRQKKYSHVTTTGLDEVNRAAKSTPAPVDGPRLKIADNGYLAASQIVLNPLQVGVAMMNAGQDINLIDDQATKSDLIAESIGNGSFVENNNPDSSHGYQNDQVSQQEQISEVLALNPPSRSVEIQKSVEIFHAAPVQEIHYPAEYVPNVQQALSKQRFKEDYRKPSRGQFKDRRPGQSVIYKYNEIADEGVSSSNQDRGRYEFNVNENDVIVDQRLSVPRLAETKPVYEAPEHADNPQYDQTTVKHTKVHGISDYDPSKGPSSTRLIDSLSSLANLESLQDAPEVSQVFPNKAINGAPNEVRLIIPVSQQYPTEKTPYSPHQVDLADKKHPFAVEKIIEQQVTITQPFPVHVPVDRVVEKQIRIPYPVHVEKVIEKKVPFAIQRFIIPLPMHFRVPQSVPVPVEKVIEKAIPIPVPLEKSRPYTLETTKLIKTGPIYNAQNDGNYQQLLIRPNYQVPLRSAYGTENDQSHYNTTGQFYGPGHYLALNRPVVRQPAIHTLPKKFGPYSVQYPHSASYGLNGNGGGYGRASAEKEKIKDEYVGPVPRKVLQGSIGIQSKSLYSSPEVQATLRRTRQETGNIGTFRQSKMEYGFKPPMVPSVQYDEQTASKMK